MRMSFSLMANPGGAYAPADRRGEGETGVKVLEPPEAAQSTFWLGNSIFATPLLPRRRPPGYAGRRVGSTFSPPV
jgi:hypothetical protein